MIDAKLGDVLQVDFHKNGRWRNAFLVQDEESIKSAEAVLNRDTILRWRLVRNGAIIKAEGNRENSGTSI